MQLEYRTANWIANLLQEAPTDFDEWIEDGRVLCRAINKIIFNAVPNDIINAPSNDVKVCTTMYYQVVYTKPNLLVILCHSIST